MTVVGTAEVLIKAIDPGFEADVKQQVQGAVDKAAGSVKVGVDDKGLDAGLQKANVKIGAFYENQARKAAAAAAAIAQAGTPVDVLAGAGSAGNAAGGAADKIKAVGAAVQGLPGAQKITTITDALGAADAAGVSAAAGLATAGAAVLALIAAIAAIKGVQQFVDLARDVGIVRSALGGTAEDASRVRAIAVGLGIDIRGISTVLGEFGSNLGRNRSELQQYGVEIATTRQGQTDMFETLVNTVRAYQSLTDPLDKARLRQLAFGQTGIDLNLILDATPEKLRALAAQAERNGAILDEQGIKKGKDFSTAMAQLGESVKRPTLALGSQLVPVLTDVANAGRLGFQWVGDAVSKLKFLETPVKLAVGYFFPLLTVLHLLPHAHDDAGDAAKKQAASEDQLARSIQQANDAATASAQLPAAIDAVTKARERAAEAGDGITAAERNLRDAQERSGDLQVQIAERAATAKQQQADKTVAANAAVRDSEERLEAAIRNTGEKIASDEARLATARIESAQAVEAAQKAANDANLEAHRSLRDAERSLSDERARQNAGGNQALLRQLQNAGSINSAVEAVQRAREKETATQEAGAASVTKAQTDGAQKVADAQKTLDADRLDAAGQLRDAEQAVSAAREHAVEVAREGLAIGRQTTEETRQLRDATQAVEAAQKALDKARRDGATEYHSDLLQLAEDQTKVLELQAAAAGHQLTAIERNKVYAGQIEALLKTLDPSSPEAQALLNTSLIVRGIADSFQEAADKTAEWKRELAGILLQINQSGPGGGAGAARNALQDLLNGGNPDVLPGRATGGPVAAGFSYVVGEQGRERLDMFRGGGGNVVPLSGVPRQLPADPSGGDASRSALIGQLIVHGATVAGAYATGVETARAVRASEYARSGR